MQEEFRDVQGHPNFEVSNTAKVRRKDTGEYLKQFKVNKRNRVNIDGKRPYVGRLVAQEFVPNPRKKPFVTHKDGDNQNDNASNLIWVTNEEAQKIAVIRRRLKAREDDR